MSRGTRETALAPGPAPASGPALVTGASATSPDFMPAPDAASERPATRAAPAIVAIGCAVPPHRMRQDEIAEFMIAAHGFEGREARKLRELYRLTRIEERHSVIADYGRPPAEFRFFPPHPRLEPAPGTARRMEVFEREALPLAVAAARDALDGAARGELDGTGRDALEDGTGRDALEGGGRTTLRAGAVDRSDIDHLIVVSCTGAAAPGLDGALVAALGLREDVGRTMVGFQGCHAGLAALRLAAGLAAAKPDQAVLMVCVELSTLHFQLDPTEENLVANALFADGAAAVVVAGPELLRRAGTRGAASRGTASRGSTSHGAVPPRFEITGMRTLLRPAGRDAMVWTIGDTGFRLRLSPLLPRLIALDLGAALGPLLDERPAFWAVHPGGSAILHAVESALELPTEALRASRAVLRRYGNMSSPTVFFVLRELLARDAAPGTGGIALAFGPGLTIEAVRLARC